MKKLAVMACLAAALSASAEVIIGNGDRIAFLVHIAPKGVPAAGVHYSDNWFSLLPGESKVVEAEHPAGGCDWTAVDFPKEVAR